MSAWQGGKSTALKGRRPELALSPARRGTLDKSFCLSEPGSPPLQNDVVVGLHDLQSALHLEAGGTAVK